MHVHFRYATTFQFLNGFSLQDISMDIIQLYINFQFLNGFSPGRNSRNREDDKGNFQFLNGFSQRHDIT